MARRRKINLAFPTGYPYALFVVKSPVKTVYVAACSEHHAKQAAEKLVLVDKKTVIDPAQVKPIVDSRGHKDANKLLKSFAKEWMTKEGCIYFKELKT